MNTFYKPYHEVGGDYFDFIELGNNKIGFCVAEVSGKGMAAALLMLNFQATLHALFASGVPMNQFNDLVLSNAKGYEFITRFIARYDHNTHRISCTGQAVASCTCSKAAVPAWACSMNWHLSRSGRLTLQNIR